MYGATFVQPIYTEQEPAAYKGSIDAGFNVNRRTASAFSCNQFVTPIMNVMVQPGWLLNGAALTSVGGVTTGTLASGSPTITVADNDGISNGMVITCADNPAAIPSNTTVTISGSTVTMSANALLSLTGAVLTFSQKSSAFVAPVTNPRIDRIVVDGTTGIMAIVAGTENASPTPPAIPAGKLPVAQILFATSTTSISNTMIKDERAIFGLGVSGNYIPMPETVVTGAAPHTTNMAVNNSYQTRNSSLESFLLPTSSIVGAEVQIKCRGAGLFKVTQAAGQQIEMGNQTTTLGVGGTLSATSYGDVLNLKCSVADTIWTVTNSIGNFTGV